MKKFKFELEDILRLRQFEQEQAQIELGKAVTEETKIQNGLNELAKQYAIVKQQMQGNLDFSQIASSQQFYTLLNLQKEKLLSDLAQAKIVTEEKRKEFFKTMQKTESLSKLKEKQLELYKSEEKLDELKTIDDIVNSRQHKA